MLFKIGRDYCHKKGGILVTIPDASTQAFLMKALGWLKFDPDSKGLWIGLNDRADEDHWKWDNGMLFLILISAKYHETHTRLNVCFVKFNAILNKIAFI